MEKGVWSCTKEVHRCNTEKIVCLEVTRTSRGRGRFKKIRLQTVRNDFETLNLTAKIVLDPIEWKRN